MVPKRAISLLKALAVVGFLYKFASVLTSSLGSHNTTPSPEPEKASLFRTQFTQLHRDFVNLKPKCNPLDKYLEDSQDYHQYFGYDDYKVRLDDEILAGLLDISKAQEKELTKANKALISYLAKGSKFLSSFKSSLEESKLIRETNGIVYVSDERLFWLTFASIKYQRDINQDLTSIEIFTPLKSSICSELASGFENVHCSSFDQFLPIDIMTTFEEGYQYKSLALLLSPFENTLYLDSDNFLLRPADELFTNEKYVSTGLVIWPDFWKRSTNPLYFKMISKYHLMQLLHLGTMPAVESGQMLVNKQKHLRTLILAYYYNVHGPDYFYPLFSQGFPGEGDKETFLLASIALDEPYHFIVTKTQISGYNEIIDDVFYGQAILQPDPSKSNSFVFLHCNYPKLKVWELDEKYTNYLTKPTEQHRSFQVVRNAKKDGDTDFIKAVGRDVELEIWTVLGGLLEQFSKHWEKIGGSSFEVSQEKIKARLEFLKSHKEPGVAL
ncbi:unnamed protein product [Kuraishia capsulata CBS 1993]|uniref:Glycosyltransferase family 71 protein n=1 Tax=Kuraishia capsulata CBS 1993 TaxID=1382522 RepID=W6MG98_9ASCO|nr:uncharacterized protein KUCA_T00001021001 [Kuraishia capsulata CBS 1993]CDK25054.1 unnamed protein product [Kuraishia capsulata CBS 1993]